MKTLNVLGMDYGASNGKGVVGLFDGSRLSLKEVNRFRNTPMILSTGMYWDIIALYRELRNSIISAQKMAIPVVSIGIDSWAQDFGIIDKQGNLLGFPHHYRDLRRINGFKEVTRQYSEYELFCRTGINPSDVCTLFQLASMKNSEKAALQCGHKLLFIPNILAYFLTGTVNCDSTLASMTAMYSIPERDWRKQLIKDLGLPDLLPDIARHSEITGRVIDPELQQIGAGNIPVVMVAQHDTASALTTISAYDEGETAYISCGTWAIIGAPVSNPLINRQVFESGFCNELGYKEQNFLVKNISGLWVMQECVKEWEYEGHKIDYDYFDDFTEKNPASSLIDLEDELFMQPGKMSSKVIDYCKNTGQIPPSTREEIYSCITYSLAAKFCKVLEQLETLTCRKYKKVHIVGGGSKNKPLCKLIKENTGKNVIAGPHEATVIGNIVAQLIHAREVGLLSEAREVINNSFSVENY
jgi:rhamnulokinase